MLWIIEDQIINGLGGAIALLISVVITAFFIPNMLRKGSVDLLISKPIGRSQLLVYKYIGGLTFMFLVTAFTVGGIWLVIALRSGFWDPSFLLVIPVLTFTFAILYAVSTLVAVFTRSAIAAMIAVDRVHGRPVHRRAGEDVLRHAPGRRGPANACPSGRSRWWTR